MRSFDENSVVTTHGINTLNEKRESEQPWRSEEGINDYSYTVTNCSQKKQRKSGIGSVDTVRLLRRMTNDWKSLNNRDSGTQLKNASINK